jgi:RNA polymerase sigma-70 factor (subfamily 1)
MNPLEGWDLARYRRYLSTRARLLRLDPRVRLRADESDLVQETLTRAAASQEPCRGRGERERLAWLERIQDRVVIDFWREHHAGKRDVACERDFQNALSDSAAQWEANLADSAATSPDDRAQREELFLRVTAALQELPGEQRDVLLAVLVLHQTLQQAAEQLGKTRGQVAGLYHRGLSRLRRLLHDLREDGDGPG